MSDFRVINRIFLHFYSCGDNCSFWIFMLFLVGKSWCWLGYYRNWIVYSFLHECEFVSFNNELCEYDEFCNKVSRQFNVNGLTSCFKLIQKGFLTQNICLLQSGCYYFSLHNYQFICSTLRLRILN